MISNTAEARRPPQRRKPEPAPDLHRPEHARYIGLLTDNETGHRRLRWDCPSKSQPNRVRTLLTDEDGGQPWCSCPGYETHGHCSLTKATDQLIERDRPDLLPRVRERQRARTTGAMADLGFEPGGAA